MDVISTFITFFLVFAGIHSILATDYIKNKAEKLLGDFFRFYRVIYVIISFITFAPVLLIWIANSASTPLVYSIALWLHPIFILLRLLSIVLFAYAFFQTDVFEFIGIKQKAKNALITSGAYGVVRHPLYTGAIIFLFTELDMRLIDLTAALLFSVYFVIGAFIEERRLLLVFGEEYRKYQQEVSMFIPLKWFRKKTD